MGLEIIITKKPKYGQLKKINVNTYKYIIYTDFIDKDEFNYKTSFPYSTFSSNISTVFITF